MRLIDADELIVQFRRAIETFLPNDPRRHMNLGDSLKCHGWEQGLMVIQEAPTIQPEPHWIPVTEDTPDEERECWITPKTTSKVYRGVFTRHYGECHRTGFICDDGFMWLNTALAWMYCEVPEPYNGVTT